MPGACSAAAGPGYLGGWAKPASGSIGRGRPPPAEGTVCEAQQFMLGSHVNAPPASGASQRIGNWMTAASLANRYGPQRWVVN